MLSAWPTYTTTTSLRRRAGVLALVLALVVVLVVLVVVVEAPRRGAAAAGVGSQEGAVTPSSYTPGPLQCAAGKFCVRHRSTPSLWAACSLQSNGPTRTCHKFSSSYSINSHLQQMILCPLPAPSSLAREKVHTFRFHKHRYPLIQPEFWSGVGSQGAFGKFPHGKRDGFPIMNIPTLT